MKKFVVSVFLAAVFCGSAFCSGADNFGNNSEEKEFLAEVQRLVYSSCYLRDDSDIMELPDEIKKEIESFKGNHTVNDNANKFFEIILKDVEQLQNRCESLDYKVQYGYEEAVRLTQNWSIYKLLEDWKKQQQTALL